MNNTFINLFYGFIAVILLTGSFGIRPMTRGWRYYILVTFGFSIGAVILHSYILAGSALLAGLMTIYRLRQYFWKIRSIEVIFVTDHNDHYLHHFLDFYRAEISKHFPEFDFRIEEEFLVVLMVSKMETVGLIIAEIKNAETLKIWVDFLVPKHRGSQLAKTFYQSVLRCIDFLGYLYIYPELQSKVHNHYLERIGSRLVDGKYVNLFSVK